jgi:hypothetical protein
MHSEDGTHRVRVRIPYALFRHIRDPWERDEPGTFLEPMHFHVEFEALPVEVAQARDANPLPPPARRGHPRTWD